MAKEDIPAQAAGGDIWTTRRAPHMEGYTVIEPWPHDNYPDAHKLSLKIGNQSFLLCNGVSECFDTKEEAIWTRDMLCIALDVLVREHVDKVKAQHGA